MGIILGAIVFGLVIMILNKTLPDNESKKKQLKRINERLYKENKELREKLNKREPSKSEPQNL